MAETEVTGVDPDVDLSDARQRRELRPSAWPVLASISAGGVVGALGRYGLSEAFITRVWTGQRLLRPFLGVGILGGFTTFSTYVVDIQQATAAGAAGTGLLYAAATLVAALLAVWTGSTITGWAVGRRYTGRNGGRAR
jgi:CrcB protein